MLKSLAWNGVANRKIEPSQTSDYGAILLKSQPCTWDEGLILHPDAAGHQAMMGEHRAAQKALFYEFNLDRHVLADHLSRVIDQSG